VQGVVDPLPDVLRGKIISVDEIGSSFLLATAAEPSGRCVRAASDALILQVMPSGDELDPVDVVKVAIGDLLPNARTIAVGAVAADSCLDARLIVSEGPTKPLPKP